ncbi:MAG: alpha-amylase family glycosyl hydrolase [Janthinobacterium lividum]
MPSVIRTVREQAQTAHKRRRQCAFIGSVLVSLFLARPTPARTLGLIKFRTPDVNPSVASWMDQAVFYEIFPRAFSPAGTLNGVTARLDDLQQLGVNVLWLMPIHPMGKVKKLGSYGSMYSVRDYYAIDSDLGTKDDLFRLVKAAHERHMRVILDEVPDHTAWDSVMMSHPAYYKHDTTGKILCPHDWTDVAALNYADPSLRKYMVDMLAYWLRTFDLDGFRCDDAGDVPKVFWDETSTTLHAIRPDVLMLAEASQPDLLGQDFNIDYAWPLLETMNQVIIHGQPASAVHDEIRAQEARFPAGSWHMLTSDDHDTRRATVRYGAQAALAASALIFTLPGAPMLYNGMEVGDATPSTGPALFEKVPIFWQSGEVERTFRTFYRAIIPLRKTSPALRHGELIWIHNSDEAHVVTYLRRSSEETVLVAVNLANTPFVGSIEADSSSWKEVPLGDPAQHAEAGMPTAQALVPPPPIGLPALSLPSFGVRIFRDSHNPSGQ